MEIVIVKYNAGNTQSVLFALERLGVNAVVTDNLSRIRSADKVIFPGVGEASSAMAYLKDKGIAQLLPALTQPVLGICLGMQLMCAHSEENDTDGLGIFQVPVTRFRDGKVPHMGWNTLSSVEGDLFKDLREDEQCYFVHSYFVPVCQYTIATTDYMHPFSAAIAKDNFWGVQFHPEKSAEAGALILKNFLSL